MRTIYDIAREYEERCETFDRTVCTGPIIDGSIMPSNAREVGIISRHAIEVFRELCDDYCLSPERLKKAIQEVNNSKKGV